MIMSCLNGTTLLAHVSYMLCTDACLYIELGKDSIRRLSESGIYLIRVNNNSDLPEDNNQNLTRS